MSAVLLDTRALLWWLADDPRLGARAREVVARCDPVVSVASLWEVAIKAGIGKLDADVGEVARAADADGFARLPISDPPLAAFQALERREDHGDPFDRMLISQAAVEGIPVLTPDRKFARYPIAVVAATE